MAEDMIARTEAGAGPASLRLHGALASFARHMSARTALKDGVLTARVVGEFSAGKTRLLRELFSSVLPTALFPVSSLERQTRLQLEITHGDAPQLTLIERAADYDDASECRVWSEFPERAALEAFDPMRHRLRLALPEPRLILASGDGYSDDDSAKRLFLIDTPGWNSGDDALAESDASTLMAGYHNLSLVYVTQATRLDGAINAQRLAEFLAAFEDADFLERHSLVFVVTHCSAEEAEAMQVRAQKLVLTQWAALGRDRDELVLTVLCVDFGGLSETRRHAFRDAFWRALLAPLDERAKRKNLPTDAHQPADLWARAVRQGVSEWDVPAALHQTQTLIDTARKLLATVLKNGEFIAGMNHYRLIGLDRQAAQIRLRQAWWRQVGCASALLDSLANLPARPPQNHPLSVWWADYWTTAVMATLTPTQTFFATMDRTLDGVDANTEGMQEIFKAALSVPHQAAVAALDSSFTRMVETAREHLTTLPAERFTATLLSLSLLEARYRDHYQQAQESA